MHCLRSTAVIKLVDLDVVVMDTIGTACSRIGDFLIHRILAREQIYSLKQENSLLANFRLDL